MLLVPLSCLAKGLAGRGAGRGSTSQLREPGMVMWRDRLGSAQASLDVAHKKAATPLLCQRVEQQCGNHHRGLMGQKTWL